MSFRQPGRQAAVLYSKASPYAPIQRRKEKRKERKEEREGGRKGKREEGKEGGKKEERKERKKEGRKKGRKRKNKSILYPPFIAFTLRILSCCLLLLLFSFLSPAQSSVMSIQRFLLLATRKGLTATKE